MDRPRVPFSDEGGDMTDPVMAREYERFVGRMPWKRVARGVARRLSEGLGEPPARLLDVACGPGHLLHALEAALPGTELHGLDISPPMLQAASARLSGSRVELHEGSAYDLPFADGEFDAVVNTDALHSFEDVPALFAEFLRVVRPGGAVLVQAWRRDVPWWLWRIARAQTEWLKSHGRRIEGGGAVIDASYTAGEVREALASCGDARAEVSTGFIGLEVLATKTG